jgi:hypothetical protein
MNFLDLTGHIAFALIALSYLVKDILLLRILSIIACTAGIIFNYFVPATPLWIVIYWNLAFILVHVYHIAFLLKERSSVHFSDEEKELYETVFRIFSPVEFMKFLRICIWNQAKQNELLTQQGKDVENIMLIYNGQVSVQINNKEVALLKDGQFIGEMSYIRGGPASANCITLTPTKYLSIPKNELTQLLQRNPAMRTAVQTVLSSDLAKKLSPQESKNRKSG